MYHFQFLLQIFQIVLFATLFAIFLSPFPFSWSRSMFYKRRCSSFVIALSPILTNNSKHKMISIYTIHAIPLSHIELFWQRSSHISIQANVTMPISITCMGSDNLVPWLRSTVFQEGKAYQWIHMLVSFLLLWWNAFSFNPATIGQHYPQYLSTLLGMLLHFCRTTSLETAV